jgi:hypothetical protein
MSLSGQENSILTRSDIYRAMLINLLRDVIIGKDKLTHEQEDELDCLLFKWIHKDKVSNQRLVLAIVEAHLRVTHLN